MQCQFKHQMPSCKVNGTTLRNLFTQNCDVCRTWNIQLKVSNVGRERGAVCRKYRKIKSGHSSWDVFMMLSPKIGCNFALSQVQIQSRERLWNYLECRCSGLRSLLWMVVFSLVLFRRQRSNLMQAVNPEQHLAVCLRRPICRGGGGAVRLARPSWLAEAFFTSAELTKMRGEGVLLFFCSVVFPYWAICVLAESALYQ